MLVTVKRVKAGFTLVEILVVVGIITILIGMLMPALRMARVQANNIKCSSMLRQLGAVYHIYAADNKGRYPPSINKVNWPFGTA